MELQNFIDKVNETEIRQENLIDDLEDLPDDLYEIWASWLPEKVADGLDVDKHRWYETSTDIYKITADGETHFIAVSGVSGLSGESMDVESCFVTLRLSKAREVKVTSYEY